MVPYLKFTASEAILPRLTKRNFHQCYKWKVYTIRQSKDCSICFSRRLAITSRTPFMGVFKHGIYNPNNPIHPYVGTFQIPGPLLKKISFICYYFSTGQRSSKSNSTNLWNSIGITTKSVHNQRNWAYQASTPRHGAFTVPALPAQQCGITVDLAVIEALRTHIPISRKESMCWVDYEFEVAAREAALENHLESLNDLLYLVGDFWFSRLWQA